MAKKARRLNQTMVIDALHETKGAVYLAATRLSCSHQAVYDWINKSPAIADIKAYYDGELVDIAEMRTREAVIEGEPWAVKMVLMTKGKGRGWVERTEISNATDDNGAPLPFRIVDYRAGLTETEE